jgi:hypothetical protein
MLWVRCNGHDLPVGYDAVRHICRAGQVELSYPHEQCSDELAEMEMGAQ